jgi:hypothetical protein
MPLVRLESELHVGILGRVMLFRPYSRHGTTIQVDTTKMTFFESLPEF